MVKILQRFDAPDGSAKYLIALHDGLAVESVYLFEKSKQSFGICLSTQVGCNRGCVFCATAQQKVERNLTQDEIINQAMVIAQDNPLNVPFKYVTLAGMGEPLDNFDNSVNALKEFHRHSRYLLDEISLSTIGVSKNLAKLVNDPEFTFRLYLSLHAPNDALRQKLIKGIRNNRSNKGEQNVTELCSMMDSYGRRMKDCWKARISYLLLRDINDSMACLDELTRLLEGKMVSVQLLFWNPVDRKRFSTGEKIDFLDRVNEEVGQEWVNVLKRRGINAYAMPSYGRDIIGGCGQLSTQAFNQQARLTSLS